MMFDIDALAEMPKIDEPKITKATPKLALKKYPNKRTCQRFLKSASVITKPQIDKPEPTKTARNCFWQSKIYNNVSQSLWQEFRQLMS
jgi:hypothetical protein